MAQIEGPKVTVKGDNAILAKERSRSLQYLSDNTSDLELNRLMELAKSPKARKMLNESFGTLKMFI